MKSPEQVRHDEKMEAIQRSIEAIRRTGLVPTREVEKTQTVEAREPESQRKTRERDRDMEMER